MLSRPLSAIPVVLLCVVVSGGALGQAGCGGSPGAGRATAGPFPGVQARGPSSTTCPAARAPGECGGRSAEIARHLARLSSEDPAERATAAEALVAIGPEALFQVSHYISRHLDDPFEHAWRMAVSVEEAIARRYQDDPRLDDHYRGLAPLRLPRRTFALPGGVAIEFVKVPAGTFVQGSGNPGTGVLLAADMPCDYAPVRKVTISRAFWMARDEVSQEQWEAVMGFNRSREKRPHLPIELISWGEAVEFCRRLSAMFPPHEFDLPTEAQWEYACRGGSTGRHAFGNRRLLRGDWRLQEEGEWHENRFGLRRMHDGVFEWCRDWFAAYPPDACTDPVGPPAGEYRAIRSNYRCCSAADCRSAHRAGFPPDPRHGVGFRPVCSER